MDDKRPGEARTLVDRAAAIIDSDPDRGSALARDAVLEAVREADAEAAIEAWRLLGFSLIAQADYDGALELFLDASEDLAAHHGLAQKPAEFLNGMGVAYRHLGLYGTAVNFLEEAARSLRPEGSIRGKASTFNNYGLTLLLLGERKSAQTQLRTALDLCKSAGLDDTALSIRGNLAWIHLQDGSIQRAASEFQAILDASADDSRLGARAAALSGLSACKEAEGERAAALSYCEQGIELYLRTGAERDLSEALRHKVQLLFALGRTAEALEAADVALASPGAKAATVRAPLLETKARCLEALGRWEDACAAWKDYVAADPRDALLKSQNELMDRSLDEQKITAASLEYQLRRKAEDMARAQETIIDALAGAAEVKDDVTGEHVRRSSRYVAVLAAAMMADGHPGLDRGRSELYSATARLHDIGKVGIPDAILQKPGPLDDAEWAVMKEHPLLGERIIERAAWRDVQSDYAAAALEIIGAHHERWDGLGYPRGLSGQGIPLGGRIMSVADVYDAMRSPRPYKDPLSHEEVSAFILSESGMRFDPAVCRAFEACADEFERIFRGG